MIPERGPQTVVFSHQMVQSPCFRSRQIYWEATGKDGNLWGTSYWGATGRLLEATGRPLEASRQAEVLLGKLEGY